jgi:hypothetical protein
MSGRRALRLLRRLGSAAALLAAARPALVAKGAKPEFGPNVLIFDSSIPSQAIQKQIGAVYATQQHNEFGPQRTALLFLPGSYSVDVPVGFYTEVMGLGASPEATRIAGNMHADASLGSAPPPGIRPPFIVNCKRFSASLSTNLRSCAVATPTWPTIKIRNTTAVLLFITNPLHFLNEISRLC